MLSYDESLKILKETNASSDLVTYDDKLEILTTKDKFVDNAKSRKDLNHEDTIWSKLFSPEFYQFSC